MTIYYALYASNLLLVHCVYLLTVVAVSVLVSLLLF